MKHFNTIKISLSIIFSLLISNLSFAETHNINAGGYYYSPSVLTINLGDTVNWYNDGGFHNVNADINTLTDESFNNPESFSSSATGSVGALIYSHVFTIPGVYNYDCSIGSHAANGMVGTVIVEMTNDIEVPENPVYVTFRVNMQGQEVNQTGVYMAGGPWQVSGNSALGYTAAGISGGTPPGIAMSDDDNDNVWEVTIPLENNAYFYWKFRNGFYNDWGAIEGAWEPNFSGLGCGFWDNGDRRILVSEDNTTFEFCFASCDEVCPADPVNVTLSVNTAEYPDPVETVEVQGSFIGWGPGETLSLSNEEGGDVWSISLNLPANAESNFLYIINEEIEVLSSVGSCVAVDFTGEFNPTRLLETSTNDTILPVVCFASCLDCGEGFEGCTDPSASNYDENATVDIGGCLYDVVFSVDMTGISPNSFQTVNVNGTFNGWCGACNELFDEDGDNIYTTTIPLTTGNIEYLFTLDGWGDQEVFDSSSTCVLGTPSAEDSTIIYYNRYDSIQAIQTNDLGVNCYSSCNPCENQSAIVTFTVDMSSEVVSENGVFVMGSFNAYNYSQNPMTDMGDGIYQTTITVTENVDYIYKFVNGGFDNIENVSGLECEVLNGYRGLTVTENTELYPVCFNSCELCPGSVYYGCTDPSAANYNEMALEDDGSCATPGCTDPAADNYNINASEDDGSCTYCNSFEAIIFGTQDASEGACNGYIAAGGQGGSGNYDYNVVNTDGIPQNPFALCAGEYVLTVNDLSSGCESQLNITLNAPSLDVEGCTDASAANYNPNATVDDGSCTFPELPCDITPTGLFVDNIIHNRVVFNWSAPTAAPSHYMLRYREVGTSSWTVMSAGPVNSNAFTGNSRTRYFMEPGTTYQWNIRARVLNEDGSTNCQSPWSASSQYTTLDACANLENLSASTEAVWATLSADAPAADWGVWQSKGKMRVVGTNSFRYVNGASDGSISVLKGNFEPSTDYEWHTKAWCTGNVDANGDSDPQYHSGWGEFSTFSTQDPCDKMPTNLSTSSNGANTAITMSWDTPESGQPDHYFLELTNVTTGQVWAWNNLAGSLTSKTKFGLTAGEYSWKIRGACGTNGTSWATIFSSSVEYTLGGARLENNSVTNLDVYPNPSRDIFNVTFTSEEAQTMTIKLVNMIGKEVFTEELAEFVGQYTQVIDMNTQPKGVYFLEILTSKGGINKKIVLQ
jgi:plastocyanin